MIKNYILLAFRNFVRNKNYTLINIIGLGIGITSCVVIFLMTSYELSFDGFHRNGDRIYRVVQETKTSTGIDYGSSTPYPFANAFRNDFPDVPLVTQMHYEGEATIKLGDHKQKIDYVLFADSLFFDVFDFEVLSGNPKVDLGQPGKVFLTKSLADKLLKGEKNGVIKLNNRVELEVAGIVADPPPNSHIRFSMVVSMSSLTGDFIGGLPLDHWGLTASGLVYMVLPENVTPSKMETQLKQLSEKYLKKEDASRKQYKLQPLSSIHFDEFYFYNPGPAVNASRSDLIALGILGLFILVIASINFINLATALAIKKSKEIGIRKTLGAKRSQLTWYFLSETFLLTLFAVALSLCATEWLLSWINSFLEKSIELNLLSSPGLVVFLLTLIVFTTVLSGFYPAIVLSGFNPVAVLKNKMSASGSSGAGVRKVLVVFQFLIAQALIIGTLVVSDQMNYFRSKPLGFEKEAVINVPMPDLTKEIRESFRTRLESNSNIRNLSYSLGAPTSDNNFSTGFYLSEKGPDLQPLGVSVKTVDRHYLDTYGIELVAGRWFSEGDEKAANIDLPEEQRKFNYVINEKAMRQLGFSSPEEVIGRMIGTGVYDVQGEVIGVVKDFHIASLHTEISPVVMMLLPRFYYDAGIKINMANSRDAIQHIENTWKAIYPEYYFEYQFLDEELANGYRNDERTFTLFKIFSGVSIFIGCLGLYGLVSFMANQKLKEIGIRKVMGASVKSIVTLFSKEFVKLIVIAFIVAAPLSWYAMNYWLEDFAYRVEIQWWVFVLAIAATLVIALGTVSYKAIRAAIANPVDSLRNE
jgi:putative ABC transport system permease protein